MSKHTKGPWGVIKTHYCLQVIPLVGADDSTPAAVAHCYGADQQANAKLIAAAPDMLAALELAEVQLEQLEGLLKPPDWYVTEVLEAVRQAINSATTYPGE